MNTLRERLAAFDWSLLSITKVAVALVIMSIALWLVLGVFGSVARGVFGMQSFNTGSFNLSVGSIQEALYGDHEMLGYGGGMVESRVATKGMMAADGYASSYMPTPPMAQGGDDAEEYEHRSHNVAYETRAFNKTCTAIEDLKPFDYVIFDSSNTQEDWCNYSFRVDVAHEAEVIGTLKALNPRDFSTNAYTIERSIENSESEIAMLERRLTSTNETLRQAESAFNTLIAQATNKGDTATLAEVINNKINTIDRLTQQVLSTQERLDRLTKNLDQQTDEIEYASFNVSVSRVMFVDTEAMADAWKTRVQQLVDKVNGTLLALTVGLIALALGAVQVLVYGAVVVIIAAFFARIMWVVVKRIWRWAPRKKQEDLL